MCMGDFLLLITLKLYLRRISMTKFYFLLFLSLAFLCSSMKWGFYAHQKINRLAVFTLPPVMISFYKENLDFITEHAVNPDKRRHTSKNEAAYHYIDIDEYGD